MTNRHILPVVLLAAVAAGCTAIPAEESIDTSCFHASFETVNGVTANWGTSDTLLVVDSENKTSRFFLTFGNNTADGEFYGESSIKTSIKYAVYSANLANVTYNPSDTTFCVELGSAYKASSKNSLVTANNAAVGIMSGSTVTMKSVCGFVKVTLQSNGETVVNDGIEYDVTDIAKVEITDSVNCLAGRVKVAMVDGVPVLKEVLQGGSHTITFVPMQVRTSDGNNHYIAGDYYLPVIPQSYENVYYNIYDADGHCTHNFYKTKKALSVTRGYESKSGEFEWPTLKFTAAFQGTTAAVGLDEKKGFGSNNLGADVVHIATGQKISGVTDKRTELPLVNNGVTYTAATTMQIGASTANSLSAALLINTWKDVWNYAGKSGYPAGDYHVGSQTEYAWIRIPAQSGVLNKFEINMYGSGKVYISDDVDPDTYAAAGNIFATFEPTSSGYADYSAYIVGAESNKDYYICFGIGYSYMVRNWTISYKVYEEE